MSKRGTLNHPKNKRLAKALKTFHGSTLGLLETLWHQAAQWHTDGVLSRVDLEDAFDAGGWLTEFTVEQLIEALTGKDHAWLDLLSDGNYYIHDWHVHCEDSVHAKLYRSMTLFGNGSKPLPRKVYGEEKASLEKQWQLLDARRMSGGCPADTLPSHALPSHALPSQAEPAPDDTPPENPFEHPKPLAYVDPIARFPVEVAAAAREAHGVWYHWAHGGLPNLHSESTAKDLNRLAAAEESQPGSILTRIKGYVTKTPSGYPRNTPLFKVLNYLGYDPPLVNASPKVYSPPTRKHENITEKRLAAQNDGQAMIDEGMPLEDVMNHLVSRYGEEMARSTVKAAGWRKTA